MVDRVNVPVEDGITNTPADNTKTVDRPSWLPENFESPEAMAKSYNDLRSDYTKKTQELSELRKAAGGKESPDQQWSKDAVMGEEALKEGEGEQPPKEAPKTVEEAQQFLPGFSQDEIQSISDYAWENGSLTDDHYEKLSKAGYPREVVDQFMEGQFAVANGQRQALINAGGGEQQVEAMFAWAAESLDQKTVDGYNAKLAAGGADALMAMENLKAKYEQSGVALPTGGFVSGPNATSNETSVFQSVAQVQTAMSDPRYKTDPAYRAEVERKLSRSNVL